MKDYYAILGVPFGAPSEYVERAYRFLTRMSHPDAFPNDPAAQTWANERMKDINEAYQTLSDPTQRARYDAAYSSWQAQQAERSGEAASPRVRCPVCGGRGQVPCLTCEGRGDSTCPGCAGQRIVTCPICQGVGTITREEYERLVQEVEAAERRADEQRGKHQRTEEAGRQAQQQARVRNAVIAGVVGIFLFVSCINQFRGSPGTSPTTPIMQTETSPVAGSPPSNSPSEPPPPPPQPSEERVTTKMIVDEGGEFWGYQEESNVTVAKHLMDWTLGLWCGDRNKTWATIRLDGKWDYFESWVGLSDAVCGWDTPNAYAYFSVFLDGVEAYKSPKVVIGQRYQIRISVTGVKAMQLFIASHNMASAMGIGPVFAEPKLVRTR